MTLDGLDSVPWRRLTNAYGSSEGVPTLLRGLVSDDPNQRSEALSDLFGIIWHQGTVYEVTSYAVPFLVAIVSNPLVPDRQHVLDLLRCIAEGSGYIQVHRSLMRDEAGDTELDAREKEERQWVSAARSAVLQQVPALLTVLEDPSVEVRRAAPWLFAALHEDATDLLPALRRSASEDPDSMVRASAVLAIGSLAANAEDFTAAESDQSVEVRLAAAIARSLNARTTEQRISASKLVSDLLPVAYSQFKETPWVPTDLALGALRDEPDLQMNVVRALAKSRERSAREAAIYAAFGLLRLRRSVARPVVDLLADALSDSEAEIRQAASRQLEWAFPECRPAADQMLSCLPADERTRGHLVVSLSRLRDERVVPYVAEAVRSPDPPVWIGEALKGLGDLAFDLLPDVTRLIPNLPVGSSAATGPDNRLPQCASWVGSLGERAAPAVPMLGWMIEHQRAAIAAAAALARLGLHARPAESILMRQAGTRDQFLQPHVLAALWHLGGDATQFVKALQERLAAVRRMPAWWAYAEELGNLGQALLPALRQFLKQDDEWLAVPAARVIWKISGSPDEALGVLARFAGPTPAGLRALEALADTGICPPELRGRLEVLSQSDFRPEGYWAINDRVEQDDAFMRTAARVLASP